MKWSEIQTRFYKLTKTNSSSMPAADLNSYITPAYDDTVATINKADSRWQWDDTNNTDLPIGVTGLTSGQQDYSLATAHLTIDRIEVKDTAGNWTVLTPLDQQDLKRDRKQAMAAYKNVPNIPEEYDVIGSSIFLYPAPNYTQTASLRVYFTRSQLNFDYTTGQFTDGSGSTSSTPGFNSLFHDRIPVAAAYDYCSLNLPENAAGLLNKLQKIDANIEAFYGRRERDDRPHMSVSTDSSK